mmetsp:Transcript_16743/g.24809  ORF Transcript_16743/g.24809 Transcript_16743/m.24809 type:complete len:534 (-) Transcript_16743:223-1824(-)
MTGTSTSDCTGPCAAGYYCPIGSTSPHQEPCGGIEYYCEEGTPKQQKVPDGYYSLPMVSPASTILDDKISEMYRASIKLCEKGYWCKSGKRYSCSEYGTYGIFTGLSRSTCTAPCPKGKYCIPTSPIPILCPAGTYGNEKGNQNPQCSGNCSKGFYCPEGSTKPTEFPCPPGIAGEEEGLRDSTCSLNCDLTRSHCIPKVCMEGYYCPSNSTSQKQIECGEAGKYCPRGSSNYTNVSSGHYSIGVASIKGSYQVQDDVTTRSGQAICEKGTYCMKGTRYACTAGTYGATEGLSTATCSGFCKAGWYCPQQSIRATQRICGSSKVYCPVGSSSPVKVSIGYYSIGGNGPSTRTNQANCPPGSYCTDGVRYLCPAGTYGSSSGLSTRECDGPAEPGHYTIEGSTSSKYAPCPAGRYGIAGMKDPLCMGQTVGHWTPPGSSDPDANECGGDMCYCPEGSITPQNVSVGFYSVGGTVTTRTGQQRCNSYQRTPPLGPKMVELCPSSTRTNETEVPLDVDYYIEPTQQYRYNYTYRKQ